MKSVFSKYATDPHILPSFQAKLNFTKLNMDKQWLHKINIFSKNNVKLANGTVNFNSDQLLRLINSIRLFQEIEI